MGQRLFTGLGIIAALILALAMRFITPYIFDIFVGLIAVFTLLEMTKMLSKMGKYNYEIVAGIHILLSYVVLMLGIIYKWPLYLMLIAEVSLIVLLFGGLFLYAVVFKKKTENEIKTRKLKLGNAKFALKKALNTVFAMLYPTLLFMVIIFLNHIQDISIFSGLETGNATSSVKNGSYLALFSLVLLFALPILTDTFAYLTGNMIGGKKLFPKISPNKTISGAIGGIIWAMIGAVCIFLIFNAFSIYSNLFITINLEFWHFIILGFASSVICILGDLFESYLKRKAQIKDSGDIFPGHGGFLDRLDSHLVNTVVILVFVLIVLI